MWLEQERLGKRFCLCQAQSRAAVKYRNCSDTVQCVCKMVVQNTWLHAHPEAL